MAVCQFCQASLSSASTTTLSYHLNHVHKELITQTTVTTETSRSQPEIVQSDPDILLVPEISRLFEYYHIKNSSSYFNLVK